MMGITVSTKARTKGQARRHRREPFCPPVPDFGSELEVFVPFRADTYARREVSPNVKAYVRTNATLLDVLTSNRVITRQMCEAGKRFLVDHDVCWGSRTRDSCIPPIGGKVHETDKQATEWIMADNRLDRVLNLAGPMAYSLLRQICVYETALGRNRGRNVPRYRALLAGLLVCAAVYGVPIYEEAR